MKLRRKLMHGIDCAIARWRAKTPIVFKRIIRIGLCISSVSVAIHEALNQFGAMEPEWWTTIYPYLIGIPAGAAATAKFTQTYNSKGRPIRKPTRKRKPKKDA